jgi:hypothetical protein
LFVLLIFIFSRARGRNRTIVDLLRIGGYVRLLNKCDCPWVLKLGKGLNCSYRLPLGLKRKPLVGFGRI